MRTATLTITLLALGAAGAAGCTEDPFYLQPTAGFEYDPALFGGDPPPPPPAPISLVVPRELETMEDAMERTALAAELMLDPAMVPYVHLDDMAISVEWTLKNLEATDGTAFLAINGGNEFFVIDLSMYLVDPDEPGARPPALMGGYPIEVPGNGQLSGVFREDQIIEASIDIDQMSRGNMPPLEAIINRHEDIESFQPMTLADPEDPNSMPEPMGPAIPRAAIPLMTQFDVSMTADRRMILEFVVRVRDQRGILHTMGMAAPMAELQPHAPAAYAPPPPAD
ncbi:MAG: hypothetical protein KA297_01255 [Kofleriaceae bacterium]|jgi:hypothetical protein|nr:hypothetical protein [Kofleriaceae bacterium]MBP6840718.1 hypothetical protein [Kofleriaceae bacterium]